MRRKQLSRLLKDAPFDALLLTSETSRRYATGFPSTAGVVYLSAKQAVFYTDFRYAEAARAALNAFGEFEAREIAVKQSYSDVVNALLEEDGVQRLALEDKTLTHAAFLSWSSTLHADTVPLGDAVEKLRVVKDFREVEQIVRAQRIAEQAFTEVLNDIRVGVTEREIAARLTYLMLHLGAENMSFDPIVVSGANSSKPHGVPGNKKIEAGDFVTMDFGCIANGYCSDMTRTVAVGHATDEMRLVYETVLSAQAAGIAAYQAGVQARNVDAAARSVIADAGYGGAFGHGFGHGVGLEIHEAPTVGQRSETSIPEGAVVTAEPGIYLPGKFGVRIEDMIFVGASHCKDLTLTPKSLLIL